MKGLALLTILLLLFGSTATATQMNPDEESGFIGPTSTFYPIQTGFDNLLISLGVSSDKEVAEKRISEGYLAAESGDTEAADRAAELALEHIRSLPEEHVSNLEDFEDRAEQFDNVTDEGSDVSIDADSVTDTHTEEISLEVEKEVILGENYSVEVVAHLSDGSEREITDRSEVSTEDEDRISIHEDVFEPQQVGDVALTAKFSDHEDTTNVDIDWADRFITTDLEAPESVVEGEKVTVVADITNRGTVEGTQEIELKTQGVVEDSENKTIEKGETKTAELAWEAPGHLEEESLAVRTGGSVNHTGSIEIEDSYSDTVIENIDTASTVKEGETLTIKLDLVNIGNSPTEEEVTISSEDEDIHTKQLDLEENEEHSIEADWEPDRTGEVDLVTSTTDDTESKSVYIESESEDVEEASTYSVSGDETVHGIDNEGNNVWTYEGHDSVVLDVEYREGNVYTASSDETVHKITEEGDQKWVFEDHEDSVRNLDVGGNGEVYTASWDGTVRKIDSNGNQVWEYEEPDDIRFSDVVVDEQENIYTAGAYTVSRLDSDGEEIWSKTSPPSPGYLTAYDESIYVTTSDGLQKMDPDGEKEWVFETEESLDSVENDEEGNIYTGIQDGDVFKVNPDGDELWSYETEYFFDIAISSDNKVLMANSFYVSKFDQENGDIDEVWKYDGHDYYVQGVISK